MNRAMVAITYRLAMKGKPSSCKAGFRRHRLVSGRDGPRLCRWRDLGWTFRVGGLSAVTRGTDDNSSPGVSKRGSWRTPPPDYETSSLPLTSTAPHPFSLRAIEPAGDCALRSIGPARASRCAQPAEVRHAAACIAIPLICCGLGGPGGYPPGLPRTRTCVH